MKTLIKNGTVVTATDEYKGDVLVDGEIISKVGVSIDEPVDRVIDASGKLVVPGGIDVHTHMELPFGGTVASDDFETGTIAAAFGGTTTIVDFAVQDQGGSLKKAWENWMAKAEGKAVVDYGFHVIMRDYNASLGKEMGDLVKEGVTSFKLFMAYPGVFLMDDASILRTMQRSAEIGATICMHAENGVAINALVEQALAKGHTAPKYHALTRPPILEAEGVHRAIVLAQVAGVPVYIVHVSSPEAMQMIAEARDKGVGAYGETCPQYLFLSHDNYEEPGFEGAKYVMTPPLRDKRGHDSMWKALKYDDLQVVSTDHCPFCMKDQKVLGIDDFSKIPNGAPGVETRMSLLYDGGVAAGRISRNRWVEIASTAPAKIFGMFPRKGTIAPGSDADIVIFDHEREQTLSAKTLHMRVDYNPYEGRKVRGVTETVLSRGRVVIENAALQAKPGSGRFLRRQPRSI
jgi:dihydropyrimidinase